MEDYEKELQREAEERNANSDNSGRRQSHFEVIGGQLTLVED